MQRHGSSYAVVAFLVFFFCFHGVLSPASPLGTIEKPGYEQSLGEKRNLDPVPANPEVGKEVLEPKDKPAVPGLSELKEDSGPKGFLCKTIPEPPGEEGTKRYSWNYQRNPTNKTIRIPPEAERFSAAYHAVY